MSDPIRLVVCGLGGIGSWAADAGGRILNVNAPGSQLLLVDGDSFEPKNVSRQNFTTYGNKAKSVAKDLIEKLPNVIILAKPAWIVDKAEVDKEVEEDESAGYISAEQLLKEGDVVFMCFDNHAARKLVLDAAENIDNITIINGGNEDDGFGCTYTYVRRNGIDVTDHPRNHYEEFINPPDKNPGEMSCAERAELEGGSQVIATNLCVASTMVFDFHRLMFADDASEIEEDKSNYAAVVMTNDKMFDLGYGTSVSRARCSEDVLAEMSDLNPDVAEVCHGRVVSLDEEITV